MGTVKYSGPIASFHCPTEATIRSLKVHFSPKQLGEGTPSPENVRPIKGWDRVIAHNDRDGIVIPEEYQKVEYICGVSNIKGENFIDTNIAMTANIKVDLIFGWILTNNPGYDRLGGFGSCGWIESGNGKEDITLRSHGTAKMAKQGRHELILTGNSWSVDGIQIATYTINTFEDSNIILLSNTLGDYADRDGRWAIYDCKIYENNNLVLHYVPCRRKSDNKPGMYDTVSGEFFTNQGTGEFICGPDVGETVEYEFGVLGKNKLSNNIDDYNFLSATHSAYSYTFSNGEFSATVPSDVRDYLVILGKEQYAPGTYTLSFDYINGGENTSWQPMMIQYTSSWYTSKVGFIANQSEGHCEHTFTINVPFSINLCLNSFGNTIQEGFNKIYNLQLELGSTATTYEPYNPNKTVYGGWVDLVSGEVCEEWKSIALESLDWNGSGNRARASNSIDLEIPPYTVAPDFIAEKYYAASYSTQLTNYQSGIALGSGGFIAYYDGETLPSGKMVYKLPEPIIHNLPPYSSELQTFLAQNNIWSNADYVEVEYDLYETQSILARKQFIIANQPHIETPSAAPLQSFVTDMAAPLKECKVHFEPKQDLNGYDKPWVGGNGVNKLEDDFESGYWNASNNGAAAVGSNYERSKNYNPCLANTEYYCTVTNAVTTAVLFFDSEFSYISVATSVSNKVFTTPENAAYFKMYFNKEAENRGVNYPSTETGYIPYSNICPIEGWTEFEVTRCGKNFSTAATGTEMAQKWPINSGSSSRELLFSNMQPGQEFTLSASFTKASEPSSNKRLYLIGSQKANSVSNSIFQGPSADGPRNVTIHNWVDVDGTIRITHNNRGLTYNDDFIEYAASLQNIQLELGDTATAFEPYNGTTIPITFPSEVGTIYGGYVDLINGKLIRDWLINTHEIAASDGTPGGTGTGGNTDYRFIAWNLASAHLPDSSRTESAVCNIAPYSKSQGGTRFWIGGGTVYMVLPNDNQAYSVIIAYAERDLNVSTYQLSTNELKSLRGTNNIQSNANGNIELKYWTH